MKIAILGFGTIGRGVFELLSERRDIVVKRVLDLKKWNALMTTEFSDISDDPEIELVVETMGGIEPARTYVSECLNKGKHVVTANKLLVSKYACELNSTARKSGKAFLFSAACGGGIAYLSNLQLTQAVDRIISLGGILNGTSNYILDKLQTECPDFEAALKKAQALGYAEKDPTSDIEGLDTIRKLILSCAVAFGLLPDEKQILRYGLSNINRIDLDYAKKCRKHIRLTSYSALNEDGSLKAWVMPELVEAFSSEAATSSNLNYAWYTAEKSGLFGYSGQGAGSLPTAANILKDILSVKEGRRNMLPEALKAAEIKCSDLREFYIRMPSECDLSMLPASHSFEKDNYTIIETSSIKLDEIPFDYIRSNHGFIMLK
ncbi:MAG: homoserine dehydrogenase [Clostridiales bacterium]|nr:homoserine dehydrogenase [Clostridiales bacterium]